jgi:tetratricopeptide (TPR) repeat protein
MKNNPIQAKLYQLEEVWSEAVVANPAVRIFSWQGANTIDYKMLKSFSMFCMSEETNITDTFVALRMAFSPETCDDYGERIIAEMKKTIDAYNEQEGVTEDTFVHWDITLKNKEESDAAYFKINVTNLAKGLKVEEGEEYLVLYITPEPVTAYNDYVKWVKDIIEIELPNTVRLLLYDPYDLKSFEPLSKKYPNQFQYIYYNLDMPGAMGQVLEQAAAQATNAADKISIQFQQHLIKMNEYIAKNDAKAVEGHKEHCIRLAVQMDAPQNEAIVHFFTHGYYQSLNENAKALDVINRAIIKNDIAIERKLVPDGLMRCQYRISKANMFLFQKKFNEAIASYKECLVAPFADEDIHVKIGVHQMLGVCYKNAGYKNEAFEHFEKGWLDLNRNGEADLKNNVAAMFFACEMQEANMEAVVEYQQYFINMKNIWGPKWYAEFVAYKKHPDLALAS